MLNILVIDDDKNIRLLFKVILESEGFSVTTAKDGNEGFDVLEKKHIDLIIVDIMMPNMDGYEFTSQVRLTFKELPILMVSAKQLPEDRKKGFVLGIDDFMVKPIDGEELALRVKSLFRRAKIQSESKLVIGDITLDANSFTVTKKGETVELPQKEFLLLFKLLSYPDKIFTRLQLMDEVWGMDSKTGWETLTVHINRLRKRFEDYPEFEIVSVRGLGYKAVKKV